MNDNRDQLDPIAFICAMPMELKPLVKKLGLQKEQRNGVTLYSGTLGDGPVVAIVTGMGTEFATAGAEHLLDKVAVRHVIVFGITGAVDNETPIGTLVLPEVVFLASSGAEYRPAPIGDETHKGKMRTGDDLLTDLEVISRLRDEGVVSLDMETASIAQVCESRGVSWSVYRVISDRATDGTIDDEVFHLSNQDGTMNAGAVARYFLKHPDRVPHMVKLARDAKTATNGAAEAAIRAGSAL
ncbi:MAG TPA: hypothetical protein VEJ87_04795 [Acidimicrobiales bacterium]|nr:hypothetical protein [Acidimicrobiales bacterium]